MSFGVAFVARPIGGAVFGHFGDRVGRKSTLVASLMLMGGSTLAIAFLPTYAMIGWLAPALLCLLRFGQGLGLGGEWGGAALLSVEHAPPGWAGRFVSIMQLGSPIGFFAANAVFLLLGILLDRAAFLAWGWRLPFLGSALLVAVGLYVRLRIAETPQFARVLATDTPERMPLARLLAQDARAVLLGGAGAVSTFALFYLATAFALAQGAGPLGYDRQSLLLWQLASSVFYGVAILLAGRLADRIGAARTLAGGACATIAVAAIFQPGLASGSLAVAGLTLCVAMFVLGFNNAPLGQWLASLFPVRTRYSGVALAFNLGGIVGGALTPIAAQSLIAQGADGASGLLLGAAGLLALVGVLAARRRADPA